MSMESAGAGQPRRYAIDEREDMGEFVADDPQNDGSDLESEI
jgi:hypothetical protein